MFNNFPITLNTLSRHKCLTIAGKKYRISSIPARREIKETYPFRIEYIVKLRKNKGTLLITHYPWGHTWSGRWLNKGIKSFKGIPQEGNVSQERSGSGAAAVMYSSGRF